jgi:hypothetical protein
MSSPMTAYAMASRTTSMAQRLPPATPQDPATTEEGQRPNPPRRRSRRAFRTPALVSAFAEHLPPAVCAAAHV